MRNDFSKVLTERPRAGGEPYRAARRSKSRSKPIGEDDAVPRKEGIKRPHIENGEWKSFTDLIGPLYRFLHSRCGTPWRKVHSEICSGLKGRNTQQQHILDHLKRAVETRLIVKDGGLCHSNGRPFMVYGSHDLFYVDPRDGILKAVKHKRTGRG